MPILEMKSEVIKIKKKKKKRWFKSKLVTVKQKVEK